VVADGLTRIDWDAPWFGVLAAIGRVLATESDVRSSLDRHANRLQLTSGHGRPLRFAAPEAAGGEPYESYIARTGKVPTRDNPHDLINALMWLRFPRSKVRLNALQAAAIAQRGTRGPRGALRDAVTLIDENGLLLMTQRRDLVEALRVRDWRRLFVDQRSAWVDEVRAVPFGHALLTKLLNPYKAITAHVVGAPLSVTAEVSELDAWLAGSLDAAWSPQRLLPLPVLGIPGWWPANETPDFYDDASVFRPLPAQTP
jgi:hypothetical protein